MLRAGGLLIKIHGEVLQGQNQLQIRIVIELVMQGFLLVESDDK